MRRLGLVQNVLRATINLGAQVEIGSNNMGPATAPAPSLSEKIWNEQDVRIMVLISLALQLFLLLAGNIRRRRTVGWWRTPLMFFVWLAYLAAYAVAASAIGLFSQYEDKYKIRKIQSPEDLHRVTIPFLWAPFLLIHLGGPDTITAFSVEDNNLWTRQFLNLVIQLSLALYVFWKSFDLLDFELLVVATPLFVAGILKYGERIWALKSGSRNGLDCLTKNEDPTKRRDGTILQLPDGTILQLPHRDAMEPTMESRALQSALLCRGLLVGRTLVQLGTGAAIEIKNAFRDNDPTDVKLKFVLTELGMIYDILYTKAIMLQSWTGIIVRFFALTSMAIPFWRFWSHQHRYAQRTTNAAITYTLFITAFLVEVYSIFMVIASPSTRAKRGTFSSWLSFKFAYCFPSQGMPRPSMGQFNFTDYCLSKKSTPKFICKVSEAMGLEKHWRNFRHVKHVEDKEMINYIVGFFNTDSDRPHEQECSREQYHELEVGLGLHDLLTLPFEHVLFRLHIFTEMHLSTLEDGDSSDDMKVLAADCRKLSNYLMYLMTVYPSMLPVGSATQDLESLLAEWIRKNHGNAAKAAILNRYAMAEFLSENFLLLFPFKEPPTVSSLKDMKEVWARLLIYSAGKCRMELHARQLGEGLELLTVIGSLMMHHGLGDVGRKLNLLAPPGERTKRAVVLVHDNAAMHPLASEDPLYAFEFHEHSDHGQTSVLAWDLLGNKRLPRLTPLTTHTQTPSQGPSTSRATHVVPEIEQPVARRQEMGIRHRAVSGAVQPPQGQIQRSSSF